MRLITDSSIAVAANTADGSVSGTVKPSPGNPRDLIMDNVAQKAIVRRGDFVVTSGTVSRRNDLPSVYPPDLPIGRITRIEGAGSLDQVPHLKPFVDPRQIEYVQVLTKPRERQPLMGAISPQLVLRLGVLCVAVVVLQVAAVSQVVIFGVSADLTPLVVAAVGPDVRLDHRRDLRLLRRLPVRRRARPDDGPDELHVHRRRLRRRAPARAARPAVGASCR